MKPDIEELRKKYIENPPEGMTSRDIRHMSEEELLDMDYFLNDDELDDELDDDLERKAFISLIQDRLVVVPPPCGLFLIRRAPQAVLSYKSKKIRQLLFS